jgi:hypothetical protein
MTWVENLARMREDRKHRTGTTRKEDTLGKVAAVWVQVGGGGGLVYTVMNPRFRKGGESAGICWVDEPVVAS